MQGKPMNNEVPWSSDVYMSDDQLAYFRQQLLTQQDDLKEMLKTSRTRLRNLRAETSDLLDQSCTEADVSFELRESERNNTKLRMIHRALERIDEGTFGYCVLTGSRIGLKRLKAQPCACMSVEAQELVESASDRSRQRSGEPRIYDYALEGV